MTDIEIVEVGPRDGLQNEPRDIAVSDKVALVDALSLTGLSRIECASFVSPKWVPQMAGSADVLRDIKRAPLVRYCALAPNLRGLEDAIAAGADEVAVFASASEGFSRSNINATIAESLDRYRSLAAAAKSAGLRTRGYVSSVIACPFDGPTEPAQVAAVVDELLEMGCYEISLGDTIGAGKPETIQKMLTQVLKTASASTLAGHYHDTGTRAIDNIDASIEMGVRVFDASVGGLGGCPYAPGAPGNVATETVARHLADRGHPTGLDLPKIETAAELARTLRGSSDV